MESSIARKTNYSKPLDLTPTCMLLFFLFFNLLVCYVYMFIYVCVYGMSTVIPDLTNPWGEELKVFT